MRHLSGALAPFVVVLGLLVAWQAASLAVGLSSFPTALEALRAVPDVMLDREALGHLGASLNRMLVGFSIAAIFGTCLGLWMGRNAIVETSANSLLMMFYPVPKAALMPIIMLWLGIGDLSKTLVIVLGVSLPIIYHAHQGARSVPIGMLWSGAAMGMGRLDQLFRIVLPAALPEIFVGFRTGLILAFITMVTSEMIVRQSGIGNLLFNALDMARYDTVYSIILVISVMGLLADALFERVRSVVLKWSEYNHELAVGSD